MSIDEDPANPRVDFSDAELDDLAADIGLRGILVPLVVHPANADGRYLLHFGARVMGSIPASRTSKINGLALTGG